MGRFRYSDLKEAAGRRTLWDLNGVKTGEKCDKQEPEGEEGDRLKACVELCGQSGWERIGATNCHYSMQVERGTPSRLAPKHRDESRSEMWVHAAHG